MGGETPRLGDGCLQELPRRCKLPSNGKQPPGEERAAVKCWSLTGKMLANTPAPSAHSTPALDKLVGPGFEVPQHLRGEGELLPQVRHTFHLPAVRGLEGVRHSLDGELHTLRPWHQVQQMPHDRAPGLRDNVLTEHAASPDREVTFKKEGDTTRAPADSQQGHGHLQHTLFDALLGNIPAGKAPTQGAQVFRRQAMAGD
mmetsp:Transcript_110544/g.319417  ORF Transcript_110544/g.319417 Transcript_110544/m.319417 type:complete len:200 (+) Transcript_110544:954-1553(+)